MKKRVHDLEAIRIADVITEQNIIFEKKPVIFPPSRKMRRFFSRS